MAVTSKYVNFSAIAQRYKAMMKKFPDLHIDFCIQQKNLTDAIGIASKAIDERNKIHNHQRRIGKLKLDGFAEQLKLKEKEIRNTKTFDDLLAVIDEVEFDGIGDLTKYDTASRIGAFLNLFPDKIYLHAGTKAGAKSLLGDIRGKKFITLDELPKEFQGNDFTASEFEDILCIFKDNFQQSLIVAWQKVGRLC